MFPYYYNFWNYWDLDHKVTFDGTKKIITIAPYITEIDVKLDIYADYKEWCLINDNAKYEQAIRAIGGETIPGGKFIGSTFFLTNGWRIRTWEGNHTLLVLGNLFTEEGTSVFIPTKEAWNNTINTFQSSIVDGVLGLTSSQADKLMSIPDVTLLTDERAKLLSLNNIDLVALVDSIWDKEIKPGVTAAEYIVNKLLTTNKFIGLQ